MPPPSPPSPITYEDLTTLELSLERIDTNILAAQSLLSAPIYSERTSLTRSIRHFWPLVLEHAPLEIDQFVQPSDSAVFAACLEDIAVERFEIPASAEVGQLKESVNEGNENGPVYGEPRSFKVRFEFAENEWFKDRVLEKKFWFRRAHDGWTGRVSEPVEIQWKKGKDLTDGLTDAAMALWKAQEKSSLLDAGIASGDSKEKRAKKTKDFEDKTRELPEYKALAKKVEASTEGSQSFFTFFGYRGRWITERESSEATKDEETRRKKLSAESAERLARREAGEESTDNKAGEAADEDANANADAEKEDENLDDPTDLALDVDIFPAGEELGIALADDVWPNAIKYFTEAQEEAELGEELEDAEDLMSDLDEEGEGKGKSIEELLDQPRGKKRRVGEA